jgi:uncharacterized Zn-binding protein involved in type VI secretion
MPQAARVGDPTGHPGAISGPGVATVLIGGRPAAVVGDTHTCAMPPLAGPHPTSTIVKGSKTVFIGGRPAARVRDIAGCGAPIVSGALTVLIGG